MSSFEELGYKDLPTVLRLKKHLTAAAFEARNLVGKFASSDPIDHIVDPLFTHVVADVLWG